jgi:hypothetical protein
MFKRSVILLSFLAYSLSLIHSLVPHHHHDEVTSEFHHDNDVGDGHQDDNEENSVIHAFADAEHFPSTDIVIHSEIKNEVQKICYVFNVSSNHISSLLSQQLKPPDLNIDYRQVHYSVVHQSLFLLRAPPVA